MSAPASRPSLTVLRAGLGGLAAVVIVQAALGFAGSLWLGPGVLAVLALAAAVMWCARGARAGGPDDPAPALPREPPTEPGWLAPAAGAALAVALAERAWAGLHRTTFLYDVLSYHLHLPASWRATGGLGLVPTPFGDPAPAYTPANAELLYGVALAAANGARLAHAGQLPFAALAALGLHAAARELGAGRGAALCTALGFLLVPEVWQQAPTAMADLAMAAPFFAAIPFLLRLERRPIAADVVPLGVALGLLLGTKFVSLVVALPLLAWMGIVLARCCRVPGRPHGLPAGGSMEPSRPTLPLTSTVATLGIAIFACGGFWYLRNTLLTGNPIFPATLSVAGRTLARGLLDGASLRASEYHVPVTDVAALGAVLSECGWALLATVSIALTRLWRTRWLPLVLGTIALVWLVVPYQQSRFFFVAWGLGTLTLAAVVPRAPRLGVALLVVASAGSILQFPTSGRLAVAAAGVLGGLVVGRVRSAWRHLGVGPLAAATRVKRVRVALATGAVLGTVAVLAWARNGGAAVPYAVGDDHDDAWAWWWQQRAPAHIAYTGSNLPLPLWGPRLEHHVRCVPIAGGLNSAPHHFLHVPPPGPLQTPSEPAPERRHPERSSWLANLDAFGADWLFVARMYPGVAAANAHDDQNFPVERAWADGDPARFHLAYANEGARIYQIHRRPTGAPP